jgi:hypothetical protein
MSFLLNPFYYAFSENFINKYQTIKKKKDITLLLDNEEPVITIDVNFDNIQIIEDYVTDNLLVDAIINLNENNIIIKRVVSEKSIISEIECLLSFNNEKYNINELSFSSRN